MKAAFPEHFVGEPERQQKLWADCIFVLDTNVLLDLYRFSDSAREALFKVMESLGERLWIPYQVAAEYFENRLAVIEDQSEAYAKSIAGLKIAKEKFNSGSRHPFVSDEVFDQFISSYDLMIKELEDKQKTYQAFVGDDVIKTKIGTLLNGRVGDPYSEERLQEVAAEGEKRYLENVPPGFQDGGKIPEATTSKLKLKKFGDLILWKQVIEKAVDANKSVILVTGEKKDDWWLKSNKRLVSALPALTKEFMDAVKQDFYLYATDRFLLKANDYLKQTTSDVVVEEVRAINKADAERLEDWEDGLFDQAINTSLSKSSPGVLWAPKKFVWKNSKGARFFPNEEDLVRMQTESELKRAADRKFLMGRQANLLEKTQVVRNRLADLQANHAHISEHQNSLITIGLSTQDERYLNCKEQLLILSSMISDCEAELAVLREQLKNTIEHYEALEGDGLAE